VKVYAFATPNSVRVPIALEELGLAYELPGVDIRKGEQKASGFLSINANGKVPVLVDPDGPDGQPFVVTESGAILWYLAEKSGRLLPADRFGRARVMEQMLFHLTGVGPTFGQLGFFKEQAAEQLPYAIHRFQSEAERVLATRSSALCHSPRSRAPAETGAPGLIIRSGGWLPGPLERGERMPSTCAPHRFPRQNQAAVPSAVPNSSTRARHSEIQILAEQARVVCVEINVLFSDLQVEGAPWVAYVSSDAIGAAIFENVSVSAATPTEWQNDAPETFTLTTP
jgi:GST-like protein